MVAWFPAKVEAAFGASPTADPATIPSALWVDITTYVKSWSTDRGRSYELGTFQAGTAEVLLYNDDDRFTPGYNPASNNLLDPARATCSSTSGGILPSDIALVKVTVTALANITLTTGAVTGFTSPYGYVLTCTGTPAGRPAIAPVRSQDEYDGVRDLATLFRVEPSTNYNFSFNHKLASGTIGTTIQAKVDWLDSDGNYLSTTSSLTANPSGSVTRLNANVTSHASARYALPRLEYNGTPTAHVLHTSDWVLAAGTTVPMPTYLNWPNVRPRVPIRITLQDSTVTYKPMFYGLAEDWVQDVDADEVTLRVVDAFDLLATAEVSTGREAQAQLKTPTVLVPLDDPANTRRNYRAQFGTEGNDALRVRRMVAHTDANELSEYVWGQSGPQPGQRALRLAPESSTVGYVPVLELPTADMLEDGTCFAIWGWFKVKKSEMKDGTTLKTRGLFTQFDANGVLIDFQVSVYVDSTGKVKVFTSGTDSLTDNEAITTNTYWDDEWHFWCVRHTSTQVILYVDYDGTNGEKVVDGTAAVMTKGWSNVQRYVALGGHADPRDNSMTAAFRGSLAGVGWKRGDASSVDFSETDAINLYRAGAAPANYPGEDENMRIQRALGWVGWPTAHTSLDSGVALLTAPTVGETNVLSEIQTAASWSGGAVFIGKDGKVVFKNRRARYNPTVGLTCSEASGTMPENEANVSMDLRNVYNQVVVNRETGNGYEANDSRSQTDYGVRTLTLDMSIKDDLDAAQAASWHLNLYKDAVPRLATLTFLASAASANTLWDYLVSLELMDNKYISLPSLGTQNTKFFVEKINLSYDQDSLTFMGSLELSPADKFTNIFVLGTSALDGAVLGW